jgi:hypothetical protein
MQRGHEVCTGYPDIHDRHCFHEGTPNAFADLAWFFFARAAQASGNDPVIEETRLCTWPMH